MFSARSGHKFSERRRRRGQSIESLLNRQRGTVANRQTGY
jgi:hypothetical protein